ncbi:MAG TPA: hypothetical protein VGA56_15370 [Opitutaceae bacterium]
MKNETETVHTPKELRNELKVLINEAKRMMSGSLSDSPADELDNLRANSSTAQERLADAYTGAKNKVVAGAKYTNTTIRENPYQSLAIAIGVGALAGAFAGVLFGRHSK